MNHKSKDKVQWAPPQFSSQRHEIILGINVFDERLIKKKKKKKSFLQIAPFQQRVCAANASIFNNPCEMKTPGVTLAAPRSAGVTGAKFKIRNGRF